MGNPKKVLVCLVAVLSCYISSSCRSDSAAIPNPELNTTTATITVPVELHPLPQSSTPNPPSASQTCSEILEVEISEYYVLDEEGYQIVTVPGGQLEMLEGYPVLPFLEMGNIALPFGTSTAELDVIESEVSLIGYYDIPIADIAPFSQGGVSYREDTDIASLYPPEVISSESTSAGLLIIAHPIQHNPTTDETFFHSHLKVCVTYVSPNPVAIVALSTDKPAYSTDDMIHTTTVIENVGDSEVLLAGVLTVKDESGQEIGSKESERLVVAPGQSRDLMLSWDRLLGEGTYDLIVVIVDGEGNVIGATSQSIQVHQR